MKRFFAWITDSILLVYLAWAISALVRFSRMSAADDEMPALGRTWTLVILVVPPILAIVWQLLVRSHGLRLFDPQEEGLARREPLPWYKDPVGCLSAIVIVITLAVGWSVAEVDIFALINQDNITQLGRFVSGFFQPDWEILGPALTKMIETIFLALMATVFAVPVSAVFSFFAARNIMPRTYVGNAVYYFMRAFFTLVRSTEPIVWAVVFCAWVGIGPFAGTLALFIHSLAALVKLYSEAIENIDEGPVEALRAVGAGPVTTVVRAVVPQLVPPFVAFTMYRWDINVRMATILGMVGAGGIGLMLLQNSNLLRWDAVAVIILCITIVVLIMDLASAKIREWMN